VACHTRTGDAAANDNQIPVTLGKSRRIDCAQNRQGARALGSGYERCDGFGQ
jgi:hypothetical protein